MACTAGQPPGNGLSRHRVSACPAESRIDFVFGSAAMGE